MLLGCDGASIPNRLGFVTYCRLMAFDQRFFVGVLSAKILRVL